MYYSISYHKLLALAQSFFAQEDDGALENKTHGVQFETLLHFTQKVGDVEPFDAAVVEQLGRAQIYWLLARLLVLSEQVVKDCAVFFVNALHFVDVFSYFLHSFEGI